MGARYWGAPAPAAWPGGSVRPSLHSVCSWLLSRGAPRPLTHTMAWCTSPHRGIVIPCHSRTNPARPPARPPTLPPRPGSSGRSRTNQGMSNNHTSSPWLSLAAPARQARRCTSASGPCWPPFRRCGAPPGLPCQAHRPPSRSHRRLGAYSLPVRRTAPALTTAAALTRRPLDAPRRRRGGAHSMPARRTAPVLTTTTKVPIMMPMMVEKDRNSTCGRGVGGAGQV